MQTDPHYNSSIRTMVTVFCSLFNNIRIERKTSGGAIDSTIHVPLIFADKAKWHQKLRQEIRKQPKDISRILPKIGVDLVGVRYDSSRKGVTTTRHTNDVALLDSSSSSNSAYYTQKRTSYRRIPYIYTFEMSIGAKNMEDSLMIIEQILPFFKPEMSVTVKDNKRLAIDTDVTIVLTDVTKESSRLNSFDDADIITWTLGFQAKGYFYSPDSEQGVILTSLVDINEISLSDEDITNKIANITARVTDEQQFDIDDSDTYTTTITEYGSYYASSSSSSSSSS